MKISSAACASFILLLNIEPAFADGTTTPMKWSCAAVCQKGETSSLISSQGDTAAAAFENLQTRCPNGAVVGGSVATTTANGYSRPVHGYPTLRDACAKNDE